MLGRLELDVDRCIEFYSKLVKTVFEHRSSYCGIGFSGSIRARYSSRVLEGAIKTVLRACRIPEDEPFYDQRRNMRCKVFAISKT